MSQQQKIIYILPEYNSSVDSHFWHLYGLIAAASAELDIALVIEKATEKPFFTEMYSVTVQRFRWYPLRLLEMYFILKRLRKQGFKTLYVHYSYIGGMAAIAAKLRVFYWNCGMPWLFYPEQNLLARIKNRYPLEYILPRVQLVTGNHTMKQMYVDQYNLDPDHIYVMPNWVDLKRVVSFPQKQELRKKYNLSLDKQIVLFVHHLSKRKGAHFLKQIRELLPESAMLVVVGGGPYQEQLRIEMSNYSESLYQYIGKVPTEKVLEYFSLADVYIMPSKEEGFPRVLVEAQSVALPYVAFDVGGTKEITPPLLKPFIVSYPDVEALVASVKTLLQEEQLYKQIQAEQLTWVQQFDQPVVVKRFIEILTQAE